VSTRYRKALVGYLEASGALRSTSVRDAFLRTPREAFIPDVAAERGIEAVYRDEAHPTKTDRHGDVISSSSQPGIMAAMLEEVRVRRANGSSRSEPDRIQRRVAERARRARRPGDLGRVRSGGGTPSPTSRRLGGSTGEDRFGGRAIGLEARRPLRPDHRDRELVGRSARLPGTAEGGGLLVMPLRLSDAVPFRQIVVTFERVGRSLASVSVIHGGFMRLRDRPDDPSLPWPVSEVAEMSDGARRVLASFSGSMWGALTAEARATLLRLALTMPRSRAIGMRVSGRSQWGLESFFALAVPEDRLVGYARSDLDELLFFTTAMLAVVDAGPPASLAHMGGRRALSRIEAYGGRDSERLLTDLVGEWRGRGRPGVSSLHVEVVFRRGGPIRQAWRATTGGSSTMLFDWS
jgi:hypothetical protein